MTLEKSGSLKTSIVTQIQDDSPQIRIEGKSLNLIKGTYQKPWVNNTLNCEILKEFPLKSRQEKEDHYHCFHSKIY